MSNICTELSYYLGKRFKAITAIFINGIRITPTVTPATIPNTAIGDTVVSGTVAATA